MRRALVALACLGACSQPAETPAPADAASGGTQLPFFSAEGYGPVHIGMTIDEASTAMGAPLVPDMDFDEPELCQTLHIEGAAGEGAVRFMAQHGRISRISDYERPDGTTPEGVGVGSADAEIRAAYPNAIEQPPKYDAPPAHDLIVWTTPETSGMRFEVGADGIAKILHVGNESILLVEGCL